jgi:hypothetical protein
MIRAPFALVLLVLLVLLARTALAAPVPPVPPPALPKGAVARLGSLAFRAPMVSELHFSPDGQTLYAIDAPRLRAWDARTGAPRAPEVLVPKADTDQRVDVVAGDRVFHIERGLNRADFTLLSELVVRARGTGAELARLRTAEDASLVSF